MPSNAPASAQLGHSELSDTITASFNFHLGTTQKSPGYRASTEEQLQSDWPVARSVEDCLYY